MTDIKEAFVTLDENIAFNEKDPEDAKLIRKSLRKVKSYLNGQGSEADLKAFNDLLTLRLNCLQNAMDYYACYPIYAAVHGPIPAQDVLPVLRRFMCWLGFAAEPLQTDTERAEIYDYHLKLMGTFKMMLSYVCSAATNKATAKNQAVESI